MLASMPKMVKPICVARNSTMRCFSWKNSREPWVASPSSTMRASPTTFFSGCMSSKPWPASGVVRRIALRAIQSRTDEGSWAAAVENRAAARRQRKFRIVIRSAGSLRAGARHAPESHQLVDRAVEGVAVAAADAVHGLGVRAELAVGVLPELPFIPGGWNDGVGTVLRQPQPAVRKNGIVVGAERLLQVVAAVETGPPAG